MQKPKERERSNKKRSNKNKNRLNWQKINLLILTIAKLAVFFYFEGEGVWLLVISLPATWQISPLSTPVPIGTDDSTFTSIKKEKQGPVGFLWILTPDRLSVWDVFKIKEEKHPHRWATQLILRGEFTVLSLKDPKHLNSCLLASLLKDFSLGGLTEATSLHQTHTCLTSFHDSELQTGKFKPDMFCCTETN